MTTKKKLLTRTKSKAKPDNPLDVKIIESVDIDINSLKPHPLQADCRTISEAEFNALVEHIKLRGYGDRIKVNVKTNRIIDGHSRWKALKKLGFKTIPVEAYDLHGLEEDAAFISFNGNMFRGHFKPKIGEILNEIEAGLPDLYADLCFETVKLDIVVDEWQADIDKMENLEPKDSLDDGLVTVKYMMPPEVKDDFLASVGKILNNKLFREVKVA